jgi:selenocysteine lyase/cysteine desulfurase
VPGHEFGRHWPHLTDLVWLNTPSIAPAADAVAAAQWRAIDRWQRGEQVIDDWEDDVEACRTLIARLLGRPRETVALVGSLAEAASLVAASLPPGQVVVAAEEFRSNLFPWLALGARGGLRSRRRSAPRRTGRRPRPDRGDHAADEARCHQ